jgi:hypothetical protein
MRLPSTMSWMTAVNVNGDPSAPVLARTQRRCHAARHLHRKDAASEPKPGRAACLPDEALGVIQEKSMEIVASFS